MNAKGIRPILIVDDDRTATMVLVGLLKGAGFGALCVHDLAGAEALVREHAVGLVLLDVHLPDGNGVEFCGRLQTLPGMEGVPVLLISANHDTAVKVKGFEAGAVDYITKPFSGPEVLARVRTHLRLRAAWEALAGQQEERIQSLSSSQATLLPDPVGMPEAGFQLCVRQTLRAGGDFCDVVPSGEGITDYVVADVSGHDLGASLWTAAFKALLGEYASPLYVPQDICRRLDRSLRRVLPDAAYVTAIYARINRGAKRLSLVNAGHPPAIHVSAATGDARLLEQEGDILGMFPDSEFGRLEMAVQPGDRLFLYSDGLVEKDGSRAEGTRRLLDECRESMKEPLAGVVSGIVARLCPGMADDDIVLLGTEV
jgi:sigma-B regulation protein RsbU (phosphoserine phosphatase)